MKLTTTTTLAITTAMFLLTACASGPRKVSMAETMASESQIIIPARSQPASPQSEKIYTQPVNKTEPCKLSTTKDQLERKNFRAYWDGDCKGGYAYGLGREIALSNTHHLEEITIHSGDGNYLNGQPLRAIDFVNNYGVYGVAGATSPAISAQDELITSNSVDFSIKYTLRATDGKGNHRYLESSPFNPVKFTVNATHGKPAYVLIDYSALPATSDQAQMALFTADPATQKPVGFRIVRFRNGVIQHQKLTADGQNVAELVQLPPEYIAKLTEGIGEAQAMIQKANADAAKAQQMEREYLHMACASDYSIKGVPAKDMEIARQICTWRDQWKEPYARAETKFKKEMEQRQQEVAQAEQQRAYIAAQQAQAAAAENAAFSASMTQMNQVLQQQNNNTMQQINQMNQVLQQQNNNTMQQINQMNQQLQGQNNQMMKSWAPQQNKTTVCQTVGSQIICR